MTDVTHLAVSVLGGFCLPVAPDFSFGLAHLGQILYSFHSRLFGDLWKRMFLSLSNDVFFP